MPYVDATLWTLLALCVLVGVAYISEKDRTVVWDLEFKREVLILLREIRYRQMADAISFQADLDALKASVEAIPARVLAAIQAAGPLTQAQLDAADAEIQAIKAEADAIAPAPAPKAP